jgi:hypothetical protein
MAYEPVGTDSEYVPSLAVVAETENLVPDS